MRCIKLTGREASIVRVIGFGGPIPGSEIQSTTHMVPNDLVDTLNGLMSAGFLECEPYKEEVGVEEMPATAFEVNPAYAHGLKEALYR